VIEAKSILRPAAIAAVAFALAACAYDYRQHTDRVAYSAGDAVKANLEAETANPSKASMSNVDGLGRNGPVTPSTQTGS
jgi:hypothetical protein